MRIVDRYLITEVFTTQVAVGLVLGLVIVGGTFVRLLGMSAGGNLPVDLLAPLVAVESLKAMVMLTPVALFLAIMLTLGRLYRDSEMTALQAAGIGQRRLYRGLLLLAVPLSLLLVWLMFFVFPWASAKSNTIQREGQQRMSLAAVEAGRFLSLASGRAVGFVGSLNEGKPPGRIRPWSCWPKAARSTRTRAMASACCRSTTVCATTVVPGKLITVFCSSSITRRC